MVALTITDLNNAKADVDHIATIATSTALTATDRLGRVKKTIDGVIVDLGAQAAITQTGQNRTAAEASAALATTQAGIATTAKTAAEAARDAANVVGKVFTSTALGITGTTSGQSFGVLSADLLELIIYTNAAGAATELFRFKTKAYLDLVLDPYYARSGYAWAIIGQSNGMAIGVRNDGRVIFGHGGDIASRLDTAESNLSTLGQLPGYDRSGYSWAIVDQNGKLALSIDNAGNLVSKGVNISSAGDIAQRLTAAEAQLNGRGTVITGYERSGYAWALLDQNGAVALGLDVNGNLISKGVNVTAGQSQANTAAIAAINKWVTPKDFACFGDSLTAASYPSKLATLLGKPVQNAGVGGQGSTQIAGRFGGVVPFLTVQNNTIPASGGVTVTAMTSTLHNNQGPGSVAGTLAGIPGALTAAYDANGANPVYTFTRNTAGTATVIDNQAAFIVDMGDLRDFKTVVFWLGRNNYSDPSTVKSDVAACVQFLKPQDKRFIVMGVITWYGEGTGTGGYNTIVQLNNDLRALYPQNFIDIRAALVRSYDPAQPNDVIDYNNDNIPRSLRQSSTDGHLNDAGNQIVANTVFQFLTNKGWTA